MGACVESSFQKKNYINLSYWIYSTFLHVSAVYFSHNSLGVLVHGESEKEEIFLTDDGINKEQKNVVELNKINIKDVGIYLCLSESKTNTRLIET